MAGWLQNLRSPTASATFELIHANTRIAGVPKSVPHQNGL